jgi:hypothetical protein
MIALTTIPFDVAGDIALEERPDKTRLGEIARRRTRIKTLDGGYVTEDRGWSPADRSFELVFKATPEAQERLEYLIENYGEFLCSMNRGLFRVSAARLVPAINEGALTLFVDVEEEFNA